MFEKLSTLKQKKLIASLENYDLNFDFNELKQDKFFHEFFQYEELDVYFFNNLLSIIFYKFIKDKINKYYKGDDCDRIYVFRLSDKKSERNFSKYLETLKKYDLVEFSKIRKFGKNEIVRLYIINEEIKFQALIINLDYLDILFDLDIFYNIK